MHLVPAADAIRKQAPAAGWAAVSNWTRLTYFRPCVPPRMSPTVDPGCRHGVRAIDEDPRPSGYASRTRRLYRFDARRSGDRSRTRAAPAPRCPPHQLPERHGPARLVPAPRHVDRCGPLRTPGCWPPSPWWKPMRDLIHAAAAPTCAPRSRHSVDDRVRAAPLQAREKRESAGRVQGSESPGRSARPGRGSSRVRACARLTRRSTARPHGPAIKCPRKRGTSMTRRAGLRRRR
jgi:hypothetical protein